MCILILTISIYIYVNLCKIYIILIKWKLYINIFYILHR